MPDLVFDPEGLHRAVLNVVTNAIDAAAEMEHAGPRRGLHRVSAPSRAWCGSSWQDNGPGIPADQMDKLFSPFVSTKKSRGTGLGLPVSQKILKRARRPDPGRHRPRQGSRFTLELPAVLPSAGAEDRRTGIRHQRIGP